MGLLMRTEGIFKLAGGICCKLTRGGCELYAHIRGEVVVMHYVRYGRSKLWRFGGGWRRDATARGRGALGVLYKWM
jgi:hypothetical protein